MANPRKSAEKRRREGGTADRGAISHRPTPQTVVLAPRLTEQQRPAKPTDLPPAAQQIWDDAVEQLLDMNAAQAIDVPALRLMCMHYAICEQMIDILGREGWFSYGSVGQVTDHPALKMFERHSSLFKGWADQFGMTTLARTRIGTLELTRTSLANDLLQGLGQNPRKALVATGETG